MRPVDGPRLLARLSELRTHGGLPSGGVTRLSFTPEDVAARAVVAGWMAEAGLTVELDAATNLIGRRAGGRAGAPTLAVGSHLDTVSEGGFLDGAYGVVAAIEAAAACGPLAHPLAVVAFANEEGSTAPPGFTGSRAIAGVPPDMTQVVDRDGRTLGDAVRAAGGFPEAIDSCAWPAGSLAAFVEMHIEQGPVLESRGAGLGVVESITARSTLEVTVSGRAAHAGTTPVAYRRDALLAASRIVVAVRRLADEAVVRVATVGAINCQPNQTNVVPSSVRLGVDIRDGVDERVMAAVAALRAAASGIASQDQVVVEVVEQSFVPAVGVAPYMQDLLEEAARRHADRVLRLPSGAGHDAQTLARIGPTGMLFVPSQAGVSHCPQESTAPEHLVAGAACLADALELLDARL